MKFSGSMVCPIMLMLGTVAVQLMTAPTLSSVLFVSAAAEESNGNNNYHNSRSNRNCERLNVHTSYTQENAPRDFSGMLLEVVERVNKVLDGVVDVQLDWTGADFQGKVGEHTVECTVTRLASAVQDDNVPTFEDESGRMVASKCFYLPFTIMDTNECTLPVDHPMRHSCQSPSICVNTEGSYECLCPRLGEESNGNESSSTSSWMPPSIADDTFWAEVESSDRSPWELSFSSHSMTSCPSMASTHGCCPEKYTAEGKKCRERFLCPVDPCQSKKNDCAPNAVCVRAENPAMATNHLCQCPDGLMGSGKACKPTDPHPKPMVMYDGVTPTDLTRKNGLYCGCTKPTIDACSGFPPCKGKHEICTITSGNQPECACKPGFVHVKEYGCVDSNPPRMKLLNDPNGDGVLRLKQGDMYKESMVQIVDDNAEDYERSLKVAYSEPLPPHCLTSVGEFTVTYTISLPWANPPYVRISRRVVIEDIDECSIDVSKYQRTCPQLIPQCDISAGAMCRNTVGSYTCQCPANTSGDGFMTNSTFTDDRPAPSSFKGGSSCVDTTKPIITLKGPNPKVFKVCSCGGLDGIMGSTRDGTDDEELRGEQRKTYEDDIREMIRTTAGAELCATHDQSNPTPSDCVVAIDHTFRGDVDLSGKVVVGDPVAKSPLHWVVPYNVQDEAGNKAATVYRDVMVQEVDLASLEKKIREEVIREQQQNKKKEIDFAVQQERKKWERESKTRDRRTASSRTGKCPPCPDCDCPETEVDGAACVAYCTDLSESCRLSDESWVFGWISFLGAFISPSSASILTVIIGVMGLLVALSIVGQIVRPSSSTSYDYQRGTQRFDDDMILNGSHAPLPSGGNSGMNGHTNNGSSSTGFFSPPNGTTTASMPTNGEHSTFRSPTVSFNDRPTPGPSGISRDSVYSTSPLITPSKRGSRRRTPFSDYK